MTAQQRTPILYVASSNPGKLRDFATAAQEFSRPEIASPITIVQLPHLANIAPPAEDAETFEANARGKAIYYSLRAPGAMVIADDSGLEVDALGGRPGVYSARFAERAETLPAQPGDGAPEAHNLDTRNNQRLLHDLASVLTPAGMLANLDQRTARYRCVLAAARDGLCVATAEGSVEGAILPAPRGLGGFGYDPLFYLPALEQTMAELDASTRLGLSHRGAALRALLPVLTPHLL